MNQCKSVNTPMSATINLDEDLNGKNVDQTSYRGIIGSLLYLIASLSDIMFSIRLCTRFQLTQKNSFNGS